MLFFSPFDCVCVTDSPIIAVIADETVVEGSDASLSCNATGNPVPQITWKKVNVPDTFLANGSALTIKSINRNKAGSYQCTASNGIGEAAQATGVIIVNCKEILACVEHDQLLHICDCLSIPLSLLFYLCVLCFSGASFV